MKVAKSVDIDIDKIKETFFVECEDHISVMESSILELEQNPGDGESLNAIFRAAHSIKGNSRCLGFEAIGAFTHTLETVLDRLRNGELEMTGDTSSLLLESVDCIETLVSAVREGMEPDGVVNGTLKRLEALLEDGVVEEADVEPEGYEIEQPKTDLPCTTLLKIVFEPNPGILRRGIDPINTVLRELESRGEIVKTTLDTSRLPSIDEMDPELCYLSWEILLLTDEPSGVIDGCFEFIRDDSVVDILQLAPPLGSDLSIESAVSTSPCRDGGPSDKESIIHEGVTGSTAVGKKLGEILLEDKLISKAQLDAALMKQTSINKVETPSTIRVNIKKVDRLVNLVGELLITQAMVTQLASESFHEKSGLFQKAIAQLERNTSEIQEGVMSIRMLPIGEAFNRLRRQVRDLAKARGKMVNLILSGEDTELDKTVIEKLIDPLTHLLRNSVDHGIECSEKRLLKGKPEGGSVRLNAYHEGGKVVITVEDDGKGLDREEVLKKAKEKGLLEEGADLSDEEVYSLIFVPGFSTADNITDISGRGVGMDVVKRNIEGLGGMVTIHTEKNKYTRFTLKLPLTMAVIDGLVVSTGDEKFIIPITTVLESKRPAKEEVKTIEGKGEVVNVRGDYVPLIRLHRIMGIAAKEEKPWLALVVIISVDGKEYGLLVDDLLGEQQVVIKTLGSIHGLTGIAGATILGNGRVALILDGAGIVKRSLL